MSSTRRARAKVSLIATGDLYLLHFCQRLGTGKHSIQHYLGFTPDLETRLDKHRRGQGARITQVLKERGIGWDVVAVWPGNRQVENALKLHSATRICPVCTPSPRIPLIVANQLAALVPRRPRQLAALHDVRRRQVRWLARTTLGLRSWAAHEAAASVPSASQLLLRRPSQFCCGATPENRRRFSSAVGGPRRRSPRSTPPRSARPCGPSPSCCSNEIHHREADNLAASPRRTAWPTHGRRLEAPVHRLAHMTAA
jgi:hypothetical protein